MYHLWFKSYNYVSSVMKTTGGVSAEFDRFIQMPVTKHCTFGVAAGV